MRCFWEEGGGRQENVKTVLDKLLQSTNWIFKLQNMKKNNANRFMIHQDKTKVNIFHFKEKKITTL